MNYNLLLSNRLKIILDEHFKGNVSEMARIAEVSEGSISSYIKGKKKKDGEVRLSTPSAEVINSIVKNIGINSEWLLSGEGEMYKNNDVILLKEPKVKYNISSERLFNIIESQQETIKAQSKSIENLSKRGIATAEDVDTARVRKGS